MDARGNALTKMNDTYLAAVLQAKRDLRDLVPPIDLDDPNDFQRLCVRTPYRWIDPADLERAPDGKVRIGGDVVAVWKHIAIFVADKLLLSSTSCAAPPLATGSQSPSSRSRSFSKSDSAEKADSGRKEERARFS